MDALFWLVTAIAILALIALWFVGAQSFARGLDLQLAENEIRETHATIDRLNAEAQHHIVRGERGQFRRAA